jgi:hypothetical protein
MGDVIEQAEIGPGDEELDAALEMELAASFLKHPSVSLPPMSVCVFFLPFPCFSRTLILPLFLRTRNAGPN